MAEIPEKMRTTVSKNKKKRGFIMRKQAKIAAVASAAAILTICVSMTSFAAVGWVEESGVMAMDKLICVAVG